MQVEESHKQNDKEDFQTTLTCITDFECEGRGSGECQRVS